MKKAATLLFFLAFTCVQTQAQQPTANNYTMPPQQYVAGQYITVPASAFSGTAAPGTAFSLFFLTDFPTNTLRLQVTPEGGTLTTYTAPNTSSTATTTPFPQGGVPLGVTSSGQPRATIRVLPSSSSGTIQINYVLYATGPGGSYQSAVACVYVPIFTTPLNVTLADFSAEAKGAATQLAWTTQSEDGLKAFEIEWSTAADNWSVVGSLPGRGTAGNYQWQHESPAKGVNYYRVRSVSQSGASTYSAVLRVVHGGQGISVVAAPNPTRDILRIEGPEGSIAYLIDLGGKEVGRLQLSSNSTMNVQHLASGMYLLRVHSASGGVLAQERIVVKP